MTAKIIFSDVQKQDIRHCYLNKKHTINVIAKKYKISVTPIKSILKEMGVMVRTPDITSRKYYVNEHYFDTIDAEDKAYFLGLLMADGYNNEKRGAVTIVLKRTDKNILKIFSDCISTNKPLIDVINKDGSLTSRMEVCSRIFSEKLAEHGCIQSKTFKVDFPKKISDKFLRHFIRGFFDGDGCISYSYARRDNCFGNSFLSVATFTSTLDFCSGLKLYLKNTLNINSTLLCRSPENNNNIRTLQISGNKQVIKLMEWIYDGTNLFLKRKYDKYKDILDILRERANALEKLRIDSKQSHIFQKT